VTPGLTSAPGLNSILVDSAGDAIVTGQAGTNAMSPPFPPPPAPIVSSSESFVLKLDPEQRGLIRGNWGATDTKRKARFYELTAAGRRELEKQKQAWERMACIIQTLLHSEG
jgi:Transcriptional regulator PadR-like family